MEKRKSGEEEEEDIEDHHILEKLHPDSRNDLCPADRGRSLKNVIFPGPKRKAIDSGSKKRRRKEKVWVFHPGPFWEERRIGNGDPPICWPKRVKTHLFAELKGKILEAVKAPKDDFIRHGFNFYPGTCPLENLLSRQKGGWRIRSIAYGVFQCSYPPFSGYPEDGKSIH